MSDFLISKKNYLVKYIISTETKRSIRLLRKDKRRHRRHFAKIINRSSNVDYKY